MSNNVLDINEFNCLPNYNKYLLYIGKRLSYTDVSNLFTPNFELINPYQKGQIITFIYDTFRFIVKSNKKIKGSNEVPFNLLPSGTKAIFYTYELINCEFKDLQVGDFFRSGIEVYNWDKIDKSKDQYIKLITNIDGDKITSYSFTRLKNTLYPIVMHIIDNKNGDYLFQKVVRKKVEKNIIKKGVEKV